VAVSLAAAGGLAACGGSDDSSSSAASSVTSAAGAAGSAAESAGSAATSAGSSAASGGSSSSGQTLTADETEFKIALSSSSVTAGSYTITVKNDGKATHNLILKGPDGNTQKSDTIQGGQQTTMTVDLKPGSYEVWCGVGNHKAAGMDTTLTVS
jgi:plastocyanin